MSPDPLADSLGPRTAAALLAASTLWLAACGDDRPPAPGGAAPQRPRPGAFELTDVARQAGLDLVQLGGSPTVDYIIESLGCGGGWLDYDLDGDPDLYLAQGATLDSPASGPPDRLFRNDGDPDGDAVPRFTDVTEEAGLGDTAWSFGVAVADYDNDGDPDLYLTNWGTNRLYRNNGDGTFTDVAEEAGVADTRLGASAAWSDVDRDGDLDLYVANYVEFEIGRYPGRGEALARGDSTSPSGLAGPSGLASRSALAGPSGFACTWKGIEVFCGPRNLEAAADVFFRNDGDPDGDGVPTFTEATREAGLATRAYFGLGVVFFDGDDDGDDDLYVANDSVQNVYFRNLGNGKFEEAALLSGLAFNEEGHEQAGMGVASGDCDGDGRFDLVVTNFSHDHDTLYRNEGGGFFLDVSYPSGLGTPSYLTLGWGVGFIDLDHDGWQDLFVAHGHVYPQVDGREIGTSFLQRNSVFRNRGDGTFQEVTDRAGPGMALVASSRAAIFGDYDRDGDLDIAVTNLNASPYLLRNDGGAGNWLAVRLQGVRSNREGIGARILLRAGGRLQVREIRRNWSFLASNEPLAHFGLGDTDVTERIEVRWPSGTVSLVENVEANRVLTIREPPPE